MILHAKDTKGEVWSVIHVPSATELNAVVWVDDETAQYCEWSRHHMFCVCQHIVQAKRIKIIAASHLVLIDPLDDEQMKEDEMEPGKPAFEKWVKEDVLY